MGMYGLFPVIAVAGAVVLAIDHAWTLAAILLVMAVFGVWCLTMYHRQR